MPEGRMKRERMQEHFAGRLKLKARGSRVRIQTFSGLSVKPGWMVQAQMMWSGSRREMGMHTFPATEKVPWTTGCTGHGI